MLPFQVTLALQCQVSPCLYTSEEKVHIPTFLMSSSHHM